MSNFAGDAMDAITGTPDFAVMLAKAPVYAVASGLEVASGGRIGGSQKPRGNTFASSVNRTAGGVRRGIEDEYKTAATAVADDYKTRYGPLFRGDFGEFLNQAYAHPGLLAMDAAAGYSAVGAGARIGAAGGARVAASGSRIEAALAKVGDRSILPAGEAVDGGRTSTGTRYRAPRRYETRLGENSDATNFIEVDRRPYSRNPVTRGVQKQVGKATRPFVEFLERKGAEAPGALGEFSAEAKYRRKAGNIARDMRYENDLEKALRLRRGIAGFTQAARAAAGGGRISHRSRLGKTERGSAVVYMHSRDMLRIPGKSAREARDDLVAFLERGVEERRAAGQRTRRSEKNLRALRAVPDEHLDLRTAPQAVKDAVEQARDISRQSTELRVQAGTITPETAAAVGPRAAQVVHANVVFDRKLRRNTPELVEAATRLEHARTARDAGPAMPNRTSYVNVGRQIGRGERNLELVPGLRRGQQRQPGQPTRRMDTVASQPRAKNDGAEYRAREFSKRLAEQMGDPRRPKAPDDQRPRPVLRMDEIPHPPANPGVTRHGISAGEGSAYSQIGRGRGRQYVYRQREETVKGLRKDVKEARKELKRVEKKPGVKGTWTRPRLPIQDPALWGRADEVGSKAVYVPDRPADPRAGAQPGHASGSLGRFTAEPVHQNQGSLLASGNVDLHYKNISRAYEQALVDDMHPGAVRDLIDQFAYRRPGGEIAKGKRALIAMEADPQNVVLVSEKTLADAMRNARNRGVENIEGDPTTGVQFLEGEEGLQAAKTASELKRKGSDLVAIPKSVVNAWRQGYSQQSMGKWGQRLYDTPLQLWRRGILAFAPRWYLNNLFGNTLQFGLLTGGDIKSILQARRGQPLGDAAPERVSASTVVEGTRMDDPLRPRNIARRGFERASDKLMDINQRFESVIRRGAWISRAKSNLRKEGVSTRGMSVDELAVAFDRMPQQIKDQVLREVELGMGDYVRLNSFERNVAKRIFPFYSWMRVIGRLMGSLPVQHPKRTAMLALMARASSESLNPEDFMSDIYNRGRVNLPGELALRTMAANPFTTHAELLSNVADRSLTGTLGALSRDISPIGGQQFVQYLTGRNAFGREFSAPPGHQGGGQSFGSSRMRINGATGLPEEQMPAPSLSEMLLQTVPLVPALTRGVAAGGRTPYDTASTIDLVRNRLGIGPADAELYRQPSQYERGSEPLVVTVQGQPVAITPILSLFGLNVQRRNRSAELAQYMRSAERWQTAQEQSANQRVKLGLAP